ncbi:MAG: [citrate (pro-3S)-lyase] ligase [Clostridiales bacterium]|nr:[citrate (pro-3S)-lyase] ligase [Clostridiales bacterium]
MYKPSYVNNASLSSKEGTHRASKATREFLNSVGLFPETDADFTVNLLDYNEKIVATGSLVGNVLKYIGVSPLEQGNNACAKVVSELVSHAYSNGILKLFLFTKTENESLFNSLGFYTLAKTNFACMMENDRQGLDNFINSLSVVPKEYNESQTEIGSIVCNCNPVTNGHLYLLETAAQACRLLHVFVLSEDRSMFSTKVRFELVEKSTAHIKNICLHSSSDYIISSATFPTYFIKDSANSKNINADLDLALFGSKIAPELGITKRFVGTEPYCPVTNSYNERMKIMLPKYGIEFVEIERKGGISASKVRKFISEKNFEAIKNIVPTPCYEYIVANYS